MPSHPKPVIDDNIVSVSVNPQTLITIFGVVTSAWNQKVLAELIDADYNSQNSVSFVGVSKESLYLDDNSTEKTINWGPFDKQMTVQLTFSHKNPDTDSWDPSSVKDDKMKEYSSNDLQTAVSLIPVDGGENGDKDYQNTTFNVTRMTLF